MEDGSTFRHKKCYRKPLPPDRSSAADTHCHRVTSQRLWMLDTSFPQPKQGRPPPSSLWYWATPHISCAPRVSPWPHLWRVCHYICMKHQNRRNNSDIAQSGHHTSTRCALAPMRGQLPSWSLWQACPLLTNGSRQKSSSGVNSQLLHLLTGFSQADQQ